MVSDPPRVVLDSNLLISSYTFGGNPRKIFKLIIGEQIFGVTSRDLTNEFLGVLRKKFGVTEPDILQIENEMTSLFQITYPKQLLNILRDKDDNRVLEAAIEGKCDYIVTGDNDLLEIGKFKNIQIVTASQFLDIFKT